MKEEPRRFPYDSCLSYRVDDSTLTKKKNPREGEGFQENDEEL